MKIRKGFISIISLIVMSVVMIMTLYLGYTTKLEYLILNSTYRNNQAYYLSEGKILMAISDDKYYLEQLYPSLLEYFRTFPLSRAPKDIIIDKQDLELGDDLNNLKLAIVDKNNRKSLKVIAESNFNGTKSKVTSSIILFNELFEIGKSVLDKNLIDIKYKDTLEELIQKISMEISISNSSGSIYGIELINFNNIILHQKDNNNFEIASYRKTMTEPYIEGSNKKEVFIIIKKFEENPVDFFIGDSNKFNEKIRLSGLIYVEGNVIISSNFEFNGIIIVKGGEIRIDNDIKPIIKGIMIVDDIVNNDFLEMADIIYNKQNVYRYGTYVPGFIEPTIDLIKSD